VTAGVQQTERTAIIVLAGSETAAEREWQQFKYTTTDKLQVDKQTSHSRPDSTLSISHQH